MKKDLDLILGIGGVRNTKHNDIFKTNWGVFYKSKYGLPKNRDFKYTYLIFNLNINELERLQDILIKELDTINSNYTPSDRKAIKIYSLSKFNEFINETELKKLSESLTQFDIDLKYEILKEDNYLSIIGGSNDTMYWEWHDKGRLSRFDFYLDYFKKNKRQCYDSLDYIRKYGIGLFKRLLGVPDVVESCKRNGISTEEDLSDDVNRIANVAINVNHRL